jgi:tetratricopeptide (TPR) repeat protein
MITSQQRSKRCGKGPQSELPAPGGKTAAGRSGKTPAGLIILAVIVIAGLAAYFLTRNGVQDADRNDPATSQTAEPAKPTTEEMKSEAVETLERLAKDLPASIEAMGAAATVYDELGKSKEAMACWRKCLDIDPSRTDVIGKLGQLALKREEYNEAVSLLRRASASGRSGPGVHHALAYTLMFLGEHEEAIDHFQKELKIVPNAVRSHYMLAQAYRQLGQYEAAERSYKRVLDIRTKRDKSTYEKNACYGLSIVLARLGDKTQAAEYRRKHEEMTRSYVESKNKADDAYDDRKTMRAVLVLAHTETGKAYASVRKYDIAEKHFLRALAVDKNSDIPHVRLSRFYMEQQKDVSAARRFALAAVAIEPSGANYALLALAHYANGDMSLARHAAKRAMEKAPDNDNYRRIARMIDGGI